MSVSIHLSGTHEGELYARIDEKYRAEVEAYNWGAMPARSKHGGRYYAQCRDRVGRLAGIQSLL